MGLNTKNDNPLMSDKNTNLKILFVALKSYSYKKQWMAFQKRGKVNG
jgi:hypothetical protein